MTKKIEKEKLEEVAVGKKIDGEIVIQNEDKIIRTIEQISSNLGSINKIKTYYLSNKILGYVNEERITEGEYNNYLNSIKQKIN